MLFFSKCSVFSEYKWRNWKTGTDRGMVTDTWRKRLRSFQKQTSLWLTYDRLTVTEGGENEGPRWRSGERVRGCWKRSTPGNEWYEIKTSPPPAVHVVPATHTHTYTKCLIKARHTRPDWSLLHINTAVKQDEKEPEISLVSRLFHSFTSVCCWCQAKPYSTVTIIRQLATFIDVLWCSMMF